MADSVVISTGTGTTMGTSDRSGVHIQHVLEIGSEIHPAAHITVTNSSTQILPARAGRRRATITNYQTVPVYVGQDTITTSSGHRLDPGMSMVVETVAVVDGITSAAYTPLSDDYTVQVVEEYEGDIPETVAGLLAWWDYSDATTLYTDAAMTTPVSSDGDTILAVRDKSGAAHHQSRASSGPTYKVNIQNSRSAALHVKASSQYLVCSTMNPSQLKPCSYFYVMKPTSYGSGGLGMMQCDSAGDRVRFYLSGTDGKMSVDIPNVALLLQATTTWNTNTSRIGLTTYGSAGAIAHYQDGSANGSGTSNQTFLGTGLKIGNADGGFDGHFFEILIYDSVLSTGNLNTIGNYLAAKWSLTWTGL